MFSTGPPGRLLMSMAYPDDSYTQDDYADPGYILEVAGHECIPNSMDDETSMGYFDTVDECY